MVKEPGLFAGNPVRSQDLVKVFGTWFPPIGPTFTKLAFFLNI